MSGRPSSSTSRSRRLLRRDRSHVSFSVLCMLNETFGTEVTHTNQRFEAAVSAPQVVRRIDNDVLLLLSSGRWDNTLEIASACNPGSSEWNAYMGNEGGVEATNETFQQSFSGMGDLPLLPHHAVQRGGGRPVPLHGRCARLFPVGGGRGQPAQYHIRLLYADTGEKPRPQLFL